VIALGKLSSGRGKASVAGFKDQFGVSWQVVPSVLRKMLNDPDPVKSKRVMDVMLKMNKIIIKDL